MDKTAGNIAFKQMGLDVGLIGSSSFISSGSVRTSKPSEGTNNELLFRFLAAVRAYVFQIPQLLKCFNVMRHPIAHIKLILFTCALMLSIKIQAQTDSTFRFKSARGTMLLPLDNYKKVIDNNVTLVLPSTSVTFITGSVDSVRSIHEGLVVSVFNIADSYSVIVKFGNYFVTYSGLALPRVKKDDYIKAGQLIGSLVRYDDKEFRLDIDLSLKDKSIPIYKWLSWQLKGA